MVVVKIRTETRVNSYDFLRGLAILGVMSAHIIQAFPVGIQIIDKLLGFGAKGVQLFFFISAITMCHMWVLRGKEENPTRNFYIRRFLRIAPLFWLAIIFYVSVNDSQDKILLHQILLTTSFLHGFWPDSINSVVPGGWSIAVEMTFYLIFPKIIKICKNNKNYYLIAAVSFYFLNTVIVTPFLSHIFLFETGSLVGSFLYMQFFNQLPIFMLGCFLYFSIEEKAPMRLVWYVMYICLWLLSALGVDKFTESKHATFLSAYIFIGIISWIVIEKKISFKPVELLGKKSYAIYLVHFYVIHLVTKFLQEFFPIGLGGFIIAYTVILMLSYVLAKIIYMYIEKPVYKFAKTITSY